MRRRSAIAAAVLGVTWAGILFARMIYPEILPTLDVLTIVFYLMIAVTLIAVVRNLIGLITYGVFGPAIISIGLNRIESLYWGLLAIFVVLCVGILLRFALEPLKLQMSHRLAIVVTAVSFTIGALMLIAEKTGNVALSFVDFLPILISSWIVERFVKDELESGIKISLGRLANTIFAVLISFLLLRVESIVEFFIYTPEMWILPVAVNLLLGSWVRIRLTERLRFGRIARQSNGGKDYSRVLTIAKRNRDFIEKYNPRQVLQDIMKLSIKEALQKASVPVPKLLATFSSMEDVRNLREIISKLPKEGGFAVKPDNGFQGKGILVIRRWDEQGFEKSDGTRISPHELGRHIEATLDGEFSGRWLPDKAFLEELVNAHQDMARLSPYGLPDIRVISFRGVPVMAMTRLPTKKSGGKANLHQGAVGAGVNIASGRIESAILAHHRKPIRVHPDTGIELIGQTIPFWQKILELAARSQQASGLGFAGVDIVISEARGPMVMEVNKRPGLEIQNANRRPLLRRLRVVEAALDEGVDLKTSEGIELMKRLASSNWKTPNRPQGRSGGLIG